MHSTALPTPLSKDHHFPHRIKHLRQKRNLSQQTFGRRFGVSAAAVSDWERGVSEAPYAVIWDVIQDLWDEIFSAAPDSTPPRTFPPDSTLTLSPSSEEQHPNHEGQPS